MLAGLLLASAATAEPISLDDWFQGPRLEYVQLSPDMKSLLMILQNGTQSFVAVRDRASTAPPNPIFASDPKQDIRPYSCYWVSNKRIACRMFGYTDKHGDGARIDRLVAFDSDGGNRRDLLTNRMEYSPDGYVRYDRYGVTSRRSDEPDTLVLSGYLKGIGNGVAVLNTNTGVVRVIAKPRDGITVFQDDGAGHVLLAGGIPETVSSDKKVTFYGRKSNDDEWKLLTRLASHSDDPAGRLGNVNSATNWAYMLLLHEGRRSLFKVDLTDKMDPVLVFWHEQRDVDNLYYDWNNRLLAVSFDTNLLGPQYIDARASAINEALTKANPNRWYWIDDMSEDGKVALFRSTSHSEPSLYYLLDATDGKARIEALGSSWPGFARRALPRTVATAVKTRSGEMKEVLFTPPADSGKKAPLVVFADGTDTSGGFGTSTYFLASRGYAVVRQYFTGRLDSTLWQKKPYLDWNGKLYEDMIDVVQWASQQPGVDGSRVCIVGRGDYGGYQALLAAAHPASPFTCAASLEGLSDLRMPRNEATDTKFIENDRPSGTSNEQVAKESPQRRAADFHMPVLLVENDSRPYGKNYFEGGREMAAKLAAAKKPHQLALIDELGDDFERAEYATLEKFLAKNLQ